MTLVPFPDTFIPASPAPSLGPRLLGSLPGSTAWVAFRPVGRDAQGVNLFASPAELRTWFGAHHERESELHVGFHRRASGRPSVTRWVMRAKREETRRRRLATLIEDCANRRPVRQFGPRGR
jgi:hypothetical protein